MPHLAYGFWALFGLLLAAALWFVHTPYVDKARVPGFVQSRVAPVVVRAPHAGIVRALQVRASEAVRAQQPLMMIDTRSFDALGLSDAAYRREALRAERLVATRIWREHAHMLQPRQQLRAKQQVSLRHQLGLLRAQESIAERLVQHARQQYVRAAKLVDAGSLSAADLQRSAGAILTAEQQRLQQAAARQGLCTQYWQLRLQHAQMATSDLETMWRSRGQVMRLAAAEAQAAAKSWVQVPAPVGGHVHELQVRVGQRIAQDQDLLVLTAVKPSSHGVEVWLSSAMVGRVRPGMPVQLHYAGYPVQEHGQATGEVTYISPVPQTDGQGIRYRGLITVHELPASVTHTPVGLAVEAHIVMRRVPLWQRWWSLLAEAWARL